LRQPLNSTEQIIDACIGQNSCSIDAILNALNTIMAKVKEIPDFMANRFVEKATRESYYGTYVSPDSVYFQQVIGLIKAFEQTFHQLQAVPKIEMELFQPVSIGMDKIAQFAQFRYQETLQKNLLENQDIEKAYCLGVEEVKAVYGRLDSNAKLEFTTALVNRVYLRETPEEVTIGLRGFPDSILYTTWAKPEDEALEGPGIDLIKLLKASGFGQKVQKCHINYDALISGAVTVSRCEGKILLDGKVVGTGPKTNSESCTLIREKKRYYLQEVLEKKVLWQQSNYQEAYLYQLPSFDLKLMKEVKEITVVPHGKRFGVVIQGHLVPIAMRDKNTAFRSEPYQVIEYRVASSGRSVTLVIA